MSFYKDGFLGDKALEFAKGVRVKHSQWFDFCYEVNRFAEETLKRFNVPKNDFRKVISATLFVRVLEGAQAAIILIERGFENEAATILRAVYETVVLLRCNVRNENFFV